MLNQVNTLEWNAFEGWPAGVQEYEVYRAVGDDGFIGIEQLGSSTLTYEDDISMLPGDFSIVRYMIKANSDTAAGLESWSNEIFFEYDPEIYLPNAFKPGGVNDEYRPVGNFANFPEYSLEIYNRWGEMVFSTDDFGTGWDGTIRGKEAPTGTYVCKLNYRSTTGRTETLQTTLILLR
jgi:gliding motility-associated-like protein